MFERNILIGAQVFGKAKNYKTFGRRMVLRPALEIWVLLEKLNMNATSGTVVKNSFLKSKGGHINIAYNLILRDFFQEFIMLSFC